MKKGMKPNEVKTALTFKEKVTVAWGYHVRGIDQHTLASIYSVNPGRISEACTSVEKALSDEKSN
jgi:hypothetical protein